MKTILIVVREFGEHKRGTRIEEPFLIQKIRESSNVTKVVAVQVKDDNQFLATVH